MVKHFWYLVLTVCMTMLMGTAAYAGTTHDPTIDVLSMVIDIGVTADAITDVDSAIDNADTPYSFEIVTGPLERHSAFSRFSKAVASPVDAATESFRPNLKVPWQYWQA